MLAATGDGGSAAPDGSADATSTLDGPDEASDDGGPDGGACVFAPCGTSIDMTAWPGVGTSDPLLPGYTSYQLAQAQTQASNAALEALQAQARLTLPGWNCISKPDPTTGYYSGDLVAQSPGETVSTSGPDATGVVTATATGIYQCACGVTQ
jgi:hypothetical protein